MPQTGLKELVLHNFSPTIATIESSCILRLATACTHLEKLEVSFMSKLSGQASRSLNELIVQILVVQSGVASQELRHLNLCGFSLARTDIAMVQNQTILKALHRSEGVKAIEFLGLSGNEAWWKNHTCFELLLDLILRCTNLKELHLRGSFFSACQTENLMAALAADKASPRLLMIDLQRSADFTSEKACQSLAAFLAKKTSLQSCNIRGQQGHRKIKVEGFYAIADENGQVD